jgi:hypothetical protein
MNILIANGEMENFFGGTQTWTITMVKFLRELGHNVHFTGVNGRIHPSFRSEYQPLINRYDLLIANGNLAFNKFKNISPIKILILHGILPQMEQPVSGADILLGVSEEVENNITKRGFKCDGIIRNPIDLDKYTTTNPVKEIKTIGFLDRRRRFPFIEELSNRFNVIQIGNPPTTQIKEELDKCDLVVARGRGIYEAMSLAKNVIVSGNNSGRGGKTEWMDGFVDDTTFYIYRENNCSGRRMKINVTNVDIFWGQIQKASVEQAQSNRLLMEKNNDARLIAKELLKYYEDCNNK